MEMINAANMRRVNCVRRFESFNAASLTISSQNLSPAAWLIVDYLSI
jgi:hypothetical protein